MVAVQGPVLYFSTYHRTHLGVLPHRWYGWDFPSCMPQTENCVEFRPLNRPIGRSTDIFRAKVSS